RSGPLAGPVSAWGGWTGCSPVARWLYTLLWWGVLSVDPARIRPVPTGPPPARPETPLPGTFGLLLSWMLLFIHTVQDLVPVAPVCGSDGSEEQSPICGDGQSSLFCEFDTSPVLFRSHSVFS